MTARVYLLSLIGLYLVLAAAVYLAYRIVGGA
jgi:hypothetical protein